MLARIKDWFRRRRSSDRNVGVDIVIQEHERPLGRILHDVHGTPFRPVSSLAEARKHPDAYVVLQGDWGGQIYLTAPVTQIKCSEAELSSLLAAIDHHAWGCNEGDGAEMFFERFEPGAGVAGGMGGGTITDAVWLHPELDEAGFRTLVSAVLSGESTRKPPAA